MFPAVYVLANIFTAGYNTNARKCIIPYFDRKKKANVTEAKFAEVGIKFCIFYKHLYGTLTQL